MKSDAPSDADRMDELEEALRLSREYNDILNVLPDIIYKIDPDGTFVYVSKSIAILGYTPEELIGKHFSAIVHPEDLPRVSREAALPRFRGTLTGMDRAPKLFDERRSGPRLTKNLVVRLLPKSAVVSGDAGSHQIVHGEVCATGHYRDSDPACTDFDGTVGLIHQVKRPLKKKENAFYGEIATFGKYDRDLSNPDKRFVGTVGIIRDISERMKLQKEKAQLEQQLFHSRKMQSIGELAGGIAHDFNNLLGVISAHTEMISRKIGAVDSQLQRYTDGILSAVGQAADLTGKLLAFARKRQEDKTPLDIHELVTDTCQLLQHALNRKIEIRCELMAQRPFIRGDQNQVKNALINIAVNARDAMPNGGTLVFSTENRVLSPSADTEPGSDGQDADYVVLSVRDTGIGMDDEVKGRLFEPFFTTKDMGKGTGLGLACVCGIVESHEGMIEVESARGLGTTFRLLFPTIEDLPSAKSRAVKITQPLTRTQGHIMLIDDEMMFLEVNTELLRDHGYSVTPFQFSRDAVAYYREHFQEIDLVMMDMIMPVLSGRESFHALKEINADVNIVFCSGYSPEHDAEILTREGVAGFLQKPFDTATLIGAVEKALRLR